MADDAPGIGVRKQSLKTPKVEDDRKQIAKQSGPCKRRGVGGFLIVRNYGGPKMDAVTYAKETRSRLCEAAQYERRA